MIIGRLRHIGAIGLPLTYARSVTYASDRHPHLSGGIDKVSRQTKQHCYARPPPYTVANPSQVGHH